MFNALPASLFATPIKAMGELSDYYIDSLQRMVLFWDVLRQRGNNYLEHQREGKPPVLQFEYEMLIDGRTLEHPCNYALLRVKPLPDVPEDLTKRPYIVVDPRAGHGPGIGGSKADSQVGMALRAGHPVYFVTFFPEPVPGQRLRDVAFAEIHFIEEVARRHPDASKPTVIGNCQAGWAVAVLAAAKPDIMGPIILSGAPLSYWSGARNNNPMRYTGGLLGGKWVESFASDLGAGLFDGAHLVSNFENLDPANTLWTKYYNLYSKVDTEPERFLSFEKWFGGYFLLNREEIDAIVADLFIGNKLARQGILTPDGFPIDLRDIRAPIVIFCSFGDNITPPQQALNWIDDIYDDDQDIIDNDQTIVYLLEEDVGHLGIFVSGRVAAKEHQELVGTLEMIDALPAGLYQMIIEKKKPGEIGVDLEPTDYTVRFEARKLADIRALDDTRKEESCFQTVDSVSRLVDRCYKTFVSPWVRAMIAPRMANTLRALHPLRIQHRFFSDLNPLLAGLPSMAERASTNRKAATADNAFVALEHARSDMLIQLLDTYRDVRDNMGEAIFNTLYGPLGFGAIFPPEARARQRLAVRRAPVPQEREYEAGDALTAVLRIVAMGMLEFGVFDRRQARVFRALLEQSRFADMDPAEIRERFKTQARLVRQDRERAINTLPILLPTPEIRRKIVDVVRKIFLRAPDEARMDHPLAVRLAQVLELDLSELPYVPAGVSVGPTDMPAGAAAKEAATPRAPAAAKEAAAPGKPFQPST